MNKSINMGISNGLNKKFTKEKFVESVFVLSVLNFILIIALSFFVFQFLDGGNGENNLENTPIKSTASVSKTPEIILPKILYNLSGEITEIGKDTITFNATIFSKDSKGEIVSDIESRKANIDSATNFKRLTFVKNSPIESEIKLSDLKVGDYVEVISDRDISNSAEFLATFIRALP